MSDDRETITTSTGTTVSIQGDFDERLVIFENNGAPVGMRLIEAGRVFEGCFQPAPFAEWALRPEMLRAIAEVLETEASR